MNEDFEFPILTVDGVIFQLVNDELCVLLTQRAFEPFLGAWALPGMYISKDQTSREALELTLIQKTGISTSQIELIEQPYAFDAPQRDPRGYAVTIAYIGLARDVMPGVHRGADDKIQNPHFTSLAKLPKLAYDHMSIVQFAHNRLKILAASSNVLAGLLPRTFTLLQLQSAYEAVLSRKLDKRNFRKKIQSLGLIETTGESSREGAHRPAQVYRFCNGSTLRHHTI